MKAKLIASQRVICIEKSDSIDKAIALMDEHAIHHLPVVSDEVLVGMLSDRDILLAVGWQHSSDRLVNHRLGSFAGPQRVDEIMSAPVVSLPVSGSLSAAARLMVTRKIGAVPLVHHEKVTGIITESDIVRSLISGTMDQAVRPGLIDEPVSEHMRAKVLITRPRDPLADVVRIFREKRIRHVPVSISDRYGNELLIGMVSDRDVRRALGLAAVRDDQAQFRGDFYVGPTTVMDVMTTGVRTISPAARLADAIETMLRYTIHALPVVENQSLVGILTQTDALRAILAREPA